MRERVFVNSTWQINRLKENQTPLAEKISALGDYQLPKEQKGELAKDIQNVLHKIYAGKTVINKLMAIYNLLNIKHSPRENTGYHMRYKKTQFIHLVAAAIDTNFNEATKISMGIETLEAMVDFKPQILSESVMNEADHLAAGANSVLWKG